MLGFLGKLFGSDAAIEKTIDTVSNGLDKLYYSDEEKAEDAAKNRSEARQMVIGWMQATSGQNLARRLLAVMITIIWLLQYVAMMALSITAVWATDPAKWKESATVIGDYAQNMNGAMMLILAFYFAAPHMGGIVNGALNKFGGNK